MDSEQYAVYRHEAVHELMRLNEECKNAFQISKWQRWNYDLEEGTLAYSQDGVARVIASIQVIGITSKSAGNWLWAWANKSFPPKVTSGSAIVRAFGETEKLSDLTKEYLPDDEYIGWEMTAIAARLLGSKGAYRCPGENSIVYVVYSSLHFADEPASPKPELRAIICDEHVTGFSTFVCQHLAANPDQEWFSDEVSEEDKWPDAWCSQCNVLFEEAGEWNEENEANLDIQILCHHCYEKKRAQNTSGATGEKQP